MKGLDTNILVRYLVKDDRKQAERASAYIREATADGESCFINHVVIGELVWVLESAYEYGKNEIADVLEKILVTKQLEIEAKDIVRQAVQDYRRGRGDLADYLIGRSNQAQGCEVTASFDRALKNSSSFIVLE
ncbi:MAG: type II toxin-antitoxin system VapC family toxin [Acidobacteria bacterium]|nr:type II toxin-antitoxin system VapC family toxin [Acidobacteriota bacterium]MBI3658474.1 type II toxin-antitoxin system VapC family toxin [Acidobacteriota bacterium]